MHLVPNFKFLSALCGLPEHPLRSKLFYCSLRAEICAPNGEKNLSTSARNLKLTMPTGAAEIDC